MPVPRQYSPSVQAYYYLQYSASTDIWYRHSTIFSTVPVPTNNSQPSDISDEYQYPAVFHPVLCQYNASTDIRPTKPVVNFHLGNLQSLFDSRSISFGELRQSSRCANHSRSNRGLTRRYDNYIVLSSSERKYGFHFLFILVFWCLFRNHFPRYTVRYDFQIKINIFMRFPNAVP